MKNMTGKVLLMIGLTVAILALAGNAVAQDRPADNMQIFLEKVRADKKLIVADNLQMTEGEAKAFWPLYGKYQSELFIIRARTLKLIKDYAGAYNNMTNSTAKRLIDEFLTIETLRVKLSKTYLPEFRKALPDVKVLRYYQIENKINAALYDDLAANIPLADTQK